MKISLAAAAKWISPHHPNIPPLGIQISSEKFST